VKAELIKAGECVLHPHDDVVQVIIQGQHAWWLTEKQLRDFAQAAQLWIEREAKVER